MPESARRSDPDAADVSLAQDGDVGAFERIYQRHSPRVNTLAEWMLGRSDTDDVLQDIFVRAWEKITTFRGEAAFGTWLHQLAVNVILRHREKTRVHAQRYVQDESSIARAADHENGIQLYTEIESAVQQLPERLRDVLVLHDMEGYKHHEIAEMLGISSSTSRWHLHAGRAKLREHFA